MNKRIFFGSLVFGALAATARPSAAASAVLLPPYTLTGRIIDFDHASLARATSGAEVRVRKGNVLLARSTIQTVEGTSDNYALLIPVSSGAIPTAAVVGEKLIVEVDDGNDTYQQTNAMVTVGAPGTVGHLSFMAATDSDGDGVADQYALMISALMSESSITNADGTVQAYDPHADYDDDGMSNYQEYLAGTNPFLASDSLRITSVEMVPDNMNVVAATFIAHNNRAYSVLQGGGTNTHSFVRHPFQQERDSTAARHDYLQTGDDDEPVRTIYLLKSGPSQLYRIHME